VPFAQKFPEADPLAIDLLEKMLQFDPRKRIDVHKALKHPWLAQLHDEAAEPSASGARSSGGGRATRWEWAGPPHEPSVSLFWRLPVHKHRSCSLLVPSCHLRACSSPLTSPGLPPLAPAPLPQPLSPPEPFTLDFEEAQLTEQNVRDLVWAEMAKYQLDNTQPM
jgi:serine/threonine protein kinase